jgi:hypothetical protein
MTTTADPETKMNDLTYHVIAAHGGLDRWSRISELSVDATLHGPFWSLRGFSDTPIRERLTVAAHQQRIAFSPWQSPRRDLVFDAGADRVELRSPEGDVVESRTGIRSSYAGYDLTSPWEPLQVGYFIGYAMWNYLTTPFLFADPGVETREAGSWKERGEEWHRLRVTFPDHIATHCAQQTFYFDGAGMLRRVDYNVDVNVGVAVAHYVSEYREFGGITFPTRRRVHRRNPDNSTSENWSIGIDIEHITVG